MPVNTNAGGGGGDGSDECTLLLQDVPKGLKAVTADSDDEAKEGLLDPESTASDSQVLEKQTYFKYNFSTKRWEKRVGTRKNNGALNATLNCEESYTIPAGDTTGGKVTANSLASQTQGTAVAADIMAGKTATVNGVKITGIKVNYGTINATLNCGQSRVLPAGSIDGGTITAASLASQTGGVTAEDGYVYSGKTYWKDGVKRTGNMSVNSLLSFSAAAYGGKQILLKWQNPYAAGGKPFSGVDIHYSTGGYPGMGGTTIYAGIGSNSAPGGWSQAVVTMPALGTGYYFTIIPYVTTSLGYLYGPTINAYAATAADLWLTFTSSQSYVIPAGYFNVDAFAVGAGGGSSTGNGGVSGNGGGGGKTTTAGISVSPGDALNVVVGAGVRAASGSNSLIERNGVILLQAEGGKCGDSTSYTHDASGGSGGGHGTQQGESKFRSGRGGSDGSNGYNKGSTDTSGGVCAACIGQGSTTRAWKNPSGTIYSGGGGGGSYYWGSSYPSAGPGAGGNGGGGNGTNVNNGAGNDGAPNTGGGAGGCGRNSDASKAQKGTGGSGIVLLHIY